MIKIVLCTLRRIFQFISSNGRFIKSLENVLRVSAAEVRDKQFQDFPKVFQLHSLNLLSLRSGYQPNAEGERHSMIEQLLR